MWRIAVILLLLFITIKIAHGEEPFVNPVQQVVIDVNSIVGDAYDTWKDNKITETIDDFVPLDDFRITPGWMKVTVSWTF